MDVNGQFAGHTMFSPELAARFDKLVTLYPVRRSALIPMLLYAQDEVGYISEAVIAELAARVGLTSLEVLNVISYYSLLRTKPVGKYHVQVCTNISCMLRGANELFEHCKQRLGVENRQTTADGIFSLEEVECIGACSWAPAVQVNYDFHENLTPESMDLVLDQYRVKSSDESTNGARA
ncbi:MAG TPA: NAD(P)H-dependent oxidoreductase subunit E [Acidisarcina sp.]